MELCPDKLSPRRRKQGKDVSAVKIKKVLWSFFYFSHTGLYLLFGFLCLTEVVHLLGDNM